MKLVEDENLLSRDTLEFRDFSLELPLLQKISSFISSIVRCKGLPSKRVRQMLGGDERRCFGRSYFTHQRLPQPRRRRLEQIFVTLTSVVRYTYMCTIYRIVDVCDVASWFTCSRQYSREVRTLLEGAKR